MKLREIKELDAPKLRERLSQLQGKLRDVRFKLGGQEAKNVREARGLRRSIARILTILAQKEKVAGQEKKS